MLVVNLHLLDDKYVMYVRIREFGSDNIMVTVLRPRDCSRAPFNLMCGLKGMIPLAAVS